MHALLAPNCIRETAWKAALFWSHCIGTQCEEGILFCTHTVHRHSPVCCSPCSRCLIAVHQGSAHPGKRRRSPSAGAVQIEGSDLHTRHYTRCLVNLSSRPSWHRRAWLHLVSSSLSCPSASSHERCMLDIDRALQTRTLYLIHSIRLAWLTLRHAAPC